MVRTGWYGGFYQEPRNRSMVTAGLSWTCAEWMHGLEIATVAADNIAVENGGPDVDGAALPMHMVCLRDMGLMLGEIWQLDALGRRLRGGRCVRVPARRATAPRHRRGRLTDQPDRDEVAAPIRRIRPRATSLRTIATC